MAIKSDSNKIKSTKGIFVISEVGYSILEHPYQIGHDWERSFDRSTTLDICLQENNDKEKNIIHRQHSKKRQNLLS